MTIDTVAQDPAQSASDTGWLEEPTARGLFLSFPMPLAMLGKDGRVELLNQRYENTYDPKGLESEEVRKIVEASDGAWHPLRLGRLDGASQVVFMQGTRVRDAVMVIVNETPGGDLSGDVARLYAHIEELEKLRSTDTSRAPGTARISIV